MSASAVCVWPCCYGNALALADGTSQQNQLHQPAHPRRPPPMAADPLTAAVSDRICKHMNDDHADAVVAYARHYGGVADPQTARMVAITTEAMQLEVDGQAVAVAFDHRLSDSEDAHRTLVAMLRAMPQN